MPIAIRYEVAVCKHFHVRTSQIGSLCCNSFLQHLAMLVFIKMAAQIEGLGQEAKNSESLINSPCLKGQIFSTYFQVFIFHSRLQVEQCYIPKHSKDLEQTTFLVPPGRQRKQQSASLIWPLLKIFTSCFHTAYQLVLEESVVKARLGRRNAMSLAQTLDTRPGKTGCGLFFNCFSIATYCCPARKGEKKS